MKKIPAILVVFATLIQIGLSVEIVEVGDDTNLEESMCKCQPFKSCDWSDKLTKQISVLSKNHPQWKILAQQFFLQICDKEHQYVWCCGNGVPASNEELIKLNEVQKPLKKETNTQKSTSISPPQKAKEVLVCFKSDILKVPSLCYIMWK